MNRLQVVLTILLGIGIPNYFSVYDAGSVSSGFDTNVLLRLVTTLLLTIVVFLRVTLSRLRLASISRQNLLPLALILYAAFLFIYNPSNFSYTDVYRLYEVVLIFFSLSVVVQSVGELKTFFKFINLYLILNLLLMILFFPDKAGLLNGRFGGSVVHPNSLSIQITLLCVSVRFLYGRQLFFLIGILMLPLIVLTVSRVGFALFLLVYILDISSNFRQRILGLLIISIIGAFLGSIFVGQAARLFMRGDELGYLISGAGRFAVWYAAYNLWTSDASNFLFGIGYGSAAEQVNVILENVLNISHWKVPNAHNEYLQIFLSFGLLGGLIYYRIFLRIFVYINNVRLKRHRSSFFYMFFIILIYGVSWTTTSYYLNFCTLYMAILWKTNGLYRS